MSISSLFVRRPVMTTLVTVAVLVFGIKAYWDLPVSDLPNVDFPTIQVNASLPGANPETMASAVATPLERQFSTIAGLSSMSSSNTEGNTAVTLQFDLSRDLDGAAQDVQAAITQARGQLPPEMPSPPIYRKLNPALQPILYIALTSPTLPLYRLDDFGETLMAQRISMVPGVAQVAVFGSQKYAVHVQLDPRQLASRGIGIDGVAQAVSQANVNRPTGTLYGAHRQYTVQATGQLLDAAAYRPLIVTYRQGQPVRLRDLGRVVDSVENDKTAAWYIKQRSVVLAIQRQPGTNTVAVASAVRQLLPSFRDQLPASVSLHTLYDRSESIRASVRDVKFTLLLALCLVVLVIFLFLRSIPATVIPGVAMPVSLVGTFIVMYSMGFSLDNLSLLALTLSVGFVVDDAIVMLENVVRHVEQGKSVLQATREGAREIGFTIVSMTLSLAAVFIPLLFMGGIVGRLFREFAVTITAAVLVSGLVSLTLTPVMCSRLLRERGKKRHGRVFNWSERVYARVLGAYQRSLHLALRHRRSMIVFTGLILVAIGVLFSRIPKGFLPSEDTGQIFAFTQAAEGISFESMVAHQKAVADIIAADPNVAAFFSSVGARGGFTNSNQGVIFMHLLPAARRKLDANQIIAELRPKLARVPGIQVFMQNPPLIRVGGRLTKAQYQLTVMGSDTTMLYRGAAKLEAKMRALPGLVDVTSDLQIRSPIARVKIDRDRAAALGVSADQIERALGYAYAAGRVSTIYAPNNEYGVILELLPRFQRDPSALSLLHLRSSSGKQVPLASVARVVTGLGPATVNHTGQLPSVTISFNLEPGVALGDAVSRTRDLAKRTLPATLTTSFEGSAQAFESSLQGLGVLLVLAVLVIYVVLGILYESFIHPVTILSALPFAAFGALVSLLVFGQPVGLYAFVGIIMLVGLVKKNGIMMIDFALAAQREGKDARTAVVEACLVRFRPIMMTSLAALMGTLPIAVGFGAGSEARRPLGLAVVGGLLFSQFLTLFVTPVFFLYMDGLHRWLRRHLSRRRPARADGTVTR
jgi:HAE1 family hydrophobic/amphiphilic exporter-1